MNRRQFLNNSALIGTGLLTGVELFSQAIPKIGANDTLNVGVIGTGDRGGGLINIMNQLPQFKVVAVADTLPFRLERGKKLAPKGVKTYKDYKKLLDDKSVDAVIIATPLSTHYQIAVDAFQAGKHIYCEKTMCYQIEEALDLVTHGLFTVDMLPN